MVVRLNRITTKTGDNGTTGLADGQRCAKSSVRIECIGHVDEANSFIGLAVSFLPKEDRLIAPALLRIQNDLFDFGADLAFPIPNDVQADSGKNIRISENQVQWIEDQVAVFNQRLRPLKSFVLPGGTRSAAYLHVCRTLVRRSERALVMLSQSDTINPMMIKYINRLSDFMFILARVANADGTQDVMWQAGLHH